MKGYAAWLRRQRPLTMRVVRRMEAMHCLTLDIDPVQRAFRRMPDWTFAQLHADVEYGLTVFRGHGSCFL
ncbi:MAG TPA: hypothetical protein VL528_04775 [Oxalicibacterium sp.]|nr:hypothetical protein [Oxalicibacterium sp.]